LVKLFRERKSDTGKLERADADNREGKDETVRTRGRDPLKPVVTIPEGRRLARSALPPQGECNVSFFQPVRIKLDPGSKTTGIALVRAEETISPETGKMEKVAHVLFLAELTHRGGKIRDRLTARGTFRRRRRGNLRYRKPWFDNRTRPEGWLAPSLQHRVDTTMAWVNRFRKFSPVSDISQKLVRFDLQQILDAFGFPRGFLTRTKDHFGFVT
jgi:hypothetical protein